MMQDFRRYFFSELEKKNQHPKNKAQILVDDLHLSRSVAYKKVNGSVPMSLEEVLLLSKKYRISLDAAIAGQEDRVMLRYPALVGEAMSPWKFVDQLLGVLTQLSASPNFTIRYTTCEITIFNYLYYPELTALKFYFYSNSVWNLLGEAQLGQDWIDTLLADEAFQAKRMRLFDILANTTTDEYYPTNMLDTTLRQIQFLRETKQVTEAFSNTVFAQLKDLTGMLSRWASEGIKQNSEGKPAATFDLYHNDVVFTNIKFLTSNAAGRMLFSTFDSPNFMVCTDERVLDHIETWFDCLKSKSIKISKEGEKNRRIFFSEILRRIAEVEQKV
ncbi:MAG: hypothetical protein Q7U74_14790 [Saprospiraceae bacterium]|nr:hypothetical protein [Saprospiraceae bacterium]